MKDHLLHTPDGVRDIYNGECRTRMQLQEKLHQVLLQYGYRDIQTPTFEFFNIFSSEIGTIPSKDLYKFFDKEGNTLVLRPDFTPSIARSAVKYYMEEDIPVKLCYMGNTFINSSNLQGRLKESTQCGAELIGDSTIAADAEILSMSVTSLKAAGLQEFQISVGHARFFAGLMEAAQISEEQEEHLRELISNKNFFGVEEFVETLEINSHLRQLFGLLGNFDLQKEEMETAKLHAADYPAIFSAIEELDQLHEYLDFYGIGKYISFELGIISDYHYYTGIIFSAYTFGTGAPIAKGGRYDKLLSYFGKNTPSIGFVIMVDQLMSALSRQKLLPKEAEEGILLVSQKAQARQAVILAESLRSQGEVVNLLIAASDKSREDYECYAKRKHIAKVEFVDGE